MFEGTHILRRSISVVSRAAHEENILDHHQPALDHSHGETVDQLNNHGKVQFAANNDVARGGYYEIRHQPVQSRAPSPS